jgi:cytoskeletal protein RodZ
MVPHKAMDMDNQRLHSELRDKIHDLESPFNERVSFEAVMKKREKKKRRAILWIPSMLVVAGLFVVGGLGMLWVDTQQAAEKSPQKDLAKAIYKPHSSQKSSSDEKGAESNAANVAIANPSEALSSPQESKGSYKTTTRGNSDVSPFVGSRVVGVGKTEIQSSDIPPKENLGYVGEVNGLPKSTVTDVLLNETPKEEYINEVNVSKASEVFSTDMLCDPQGIEQVSIGFSDPKQPYFEIPEGENEVQWDPARLQSTWYMEMAATTGSRVVVNFNEDDRLSILGNIYHANYHALLLKDVGRGVMLGAGLSYGEMVGTGEWRIREFKERMVVDSFDVVVMIPPVQSVRVYDTSFVRDRIETVGNLQYRIDKIAIPLAMRYHFVLGKMSWRAAAQINPGMSIKSGGDFFGKTEYSAIPTQRMLTLDAKFAVGPAISIYKDWLLMLEPNMMHHAYHDVKSGKTRGKTLTGFGVSILHNF